uniref:Uncharacterized protein MANES_03G089800 n=1 Tax=Rhizophora mucronata TaxID=61149 RepID=A0A2P2LZ09_RHIMU
MSASSSSNPSGCCGLSNKHKTWDWQPEKGTYALKGHFNLIYHTCETQAHSLYITNERRATSFCKPLTSRPH